MKKLFAILLSAALMLTCLTACGGGSGGSGKGGSSSYEAALDLYFKCMAGEASKAEFKKTKPDQHWSYIEQEEEGSLEESYQAMQEEAADFMEEAEYEVGKNVKITYEVVDKEKLSDDQMEDYRENFDGLKEEYGVNMSGNKLQAVYTLELEVTLKGSEGKESFVVEAEVLQYDGNWFITNMDF